MEGKVYIATTHEFCFYIKISQTIKKKKQQQQKA